MSGINVTERFFNPLIAYWGKLSNGPKSLYAIGALTLGVAAFATRYWKSMYSYSAQNQAAFCKASNRASVDIYQQFSKIEKKGKENFLFITHSVLTTLGMIHAGSPNDVKKEIATVLHMGNLKEQQWHEAFSSWKQNIAARTRSSAIGQICSRWLSWLPFTHFGVSFNYKLNQATILRAGSKLSDNAKQTYDQFYQPEKISFSDPLQACQKANQWVDKATDGEIKEILKDVRDDTVLLLLQAAIFEGKWKYAFKKEKTVAEPFTNADETRVEVPMMQAHADVFRTGSVNKGEIEILELPFKGNASMLIFLPSTPKATECLQKLDEYMTTKNIDNLIQGLDQQLSVQKDLKIGVPKMELREEWSLFEDLSHCPLMQRLANENFQNTLVKSDVEVKIEKIITKTLFRVDENGAKAVQATAVVSYAQSCYHGPSTFIINRPFAYLFFDHETKSILGMGRVGHLEGENIESPKRK